MLNQLTYDITIPVLNEEQRLKEGVTELIKFLINNDIKNCQIIIADNGSVDGTVIVATELVEAYPHIVRFISTGQRGVGLALKKSFQASKADVVGYMDVDLATDLSHLLSVISMMEKNPKLIVNGSRNLSSSKITNRKIVRTVASWCYNKCLKWMLNVRFTDGMCGFKFLPKKIYDEIANAGVQSNGWFFCTELLCIGEWLGHTIQEIPVIWHDDRNSRVKLFQLSGTYLREILKLRKNPLKQRGL